MPGRGAPHGARRYIDRAGVDERQQDVLAGVLRAAAGGVQPDLRDALVDGAALGHERVELGHRIAHEQRADAREPDPGQRLRDVDVEEDRHVPAQRLLRAGVQDRPPAQRDDAVELAQHAQHRLVLERPEGRLALGEEDLGNGHAGDALHLIVGVEEGQAQRMGDERAHRGLAGPGRADEHHGRSVLLLIRLVRPRCGWLVNHASRLPSVVAWRRAGTPREGVLRPRRVCRVR